MTWSGQRPGPIWPNLCSIDCEPWGSHYSSQSPHLKYREERWDAPKDRSPHARETGGSRGLGQGAPPHVRVSACTRTTRAHTRTHTHTSMCCCTLSNISERGTWVGRLTRTWCLASPVQFSREAGGEVWSLQQVQWSHLCGTGLRACISCPGHLSFRRPCLCAAEGTSASGEYRDQMRWRRPIEEGTFYQAELTKDRASSKLPALVACWQERVAWEDQETSASCWWPLC